LSFDPEVLIMKEIFAAGDQMVLLGAEIKKYNRRQRTQNTWLPFPRVSKDLDVGGDLFL
jgi:hypothetical protein